MGDGGELDTIFKNSDELAKFKEKILDNNDDHPSIHYTGNIYRYFRNVKQVNRSNHGEGANEFNNFLEYEGENCYIPNGSGCFLKRINYISKKDFCMEYFEFIKSYKRRTNVLSCCIIPELTEKYKVDVGIYDPKSKRILPRSVRQRNKCLYISKTHYCVIWKNTTKIVLLNGVEEIDKNFEYIKIKKTKII